MSIKLHLEISQLADGSIAVEAKTDAFDPAVQAEAAGRLWVAVCLSINETMRARGFPKFDCLSGLDPPETPN